jgi:HTH-type transcriptional regulator, cell division transcriptional repressor
LLTGEGEGVSPPVPARGMQAKPSLVQALSDIRVLRGELLKMSERMGQLEKRLRQQMEASDA